LALHQRLAEVLVNVEKDHLTISTTNANLVVSNCLDILDALSTNGLRENKHFVLDLERAKITGLGSGKQKFLVWLRESQEGVVSHHGSCWQKLIFASALIRIQRPKGQFL